MKKMLIDNLKNIPGWRTNRKLIVIAVDDYGNVRLDSKKARENLDKAGLKVNNRFDAYDTMETKFDLEALYEVLTAVRDKNERHAVFTPYALPCNIDFERVKSEGYKDYSYELLPVTFNKLSSGDPMNYNGAWDMWKEGISHGLMTPQFHGREHLNLKVFREKLRKQDKELMFCLKNRSYTSISSSGYDTIGYTQSFAFSDKTEVEDFPEILNSGIKAFKEVYNVSPTVFTPPAQQFPKSLEPSLKDFGLIYYNMPFFQKRHIGGGKYKTEFNFSGYNRTNDSFTQVRNVVFEPNDNRNIDWIPYCIKQIEAAFRWRKPAIISSHRVNFCGYIDENNRKQGLESLKILLKKIVDTWPDVEFVSANELGSIMRDNKK